MEQERHLELERHGPALGESEPGRDTNTFLRALATAARSFVFYEPENEAIRSFLEEVDTSIEVALRHGDIVLDVRPWEMVRGDEVVYRETERERSLAFRLYRDGVRRLTLQTGVTWDELTLLLGILSIRYTGVRQQEDDIVTLLWKANFEHISTEAVEGFVPKDDETGGMPLSGKGPRNRLEAAVFGAPYRFDYPWPRFSDSGEVAYRELDTDVRHTLQEEDGSQMLPVHCLRLVEELLNPRGASTEQFDAELVVPLFREIRDFVLGERLHDTLLEMAKAVHRIPDFDAEYRTQLLDALAERRALVRLVDSVIDGHGSLDTLLELLGLVSDDTHGGVLEVFRDKWTGAGRQVGREFIERTIADRIKEVSVFTRNTKGAMAADLMQLVAEHDLAQGGRLAAVLLQQNDRQVQIPALEILERAPYLSELGRAITRALESPQEEVRCRAAAVLVAKEERRGFEPILRRLESRPPTSGLSRGELSALGEAMARLNPHRALTTFQGWMKPPGLLGKLRSGREDLVRAALSGLAVIPGPASLRLIQEAQKKASPAIATCCAHALAQHRRQQDGGSRA